MTELVLTVLSGLPIIAGAGVLSHLESRKHDPSSRAYRARSSRGVRRRAGKSCPSNYAGGASA